MDPMEERLRELLHQGTPQPPIRLDPEVLVQRAGARPPARRWAPFALAAAAVVVVAAVVAGVLLAGTHRTPTPPTTPTPAPPTAVSTAPTSPPPGSTPPAGSVPPAPSGGGGGSSAPAPAPVAVGPTGGPVPPGFVPESATFVSASDGWVLGNAPCATPPCTSVVRTRDGGASWVGIPAPRATFAPRSAATSPTGVGALRFADTTHGWAYAPDLWTTSDGGATWTQQPVPAGGRVLDLQTGGGIVVAEVQPTSGGASRVWGTRVGSTSWTALSGPLDLGGRLAVHGTDWFATTGSGVVHGHGLAAPVSLTPPCGGNTPRPGPLAVVDADHVDVVCVGDAGAGSSLQLLVGTADGGRTWSAGGTAQPAPGGLGGIADNGAGVLLSAQTSGANAVVRTTDDGRTYGVVLRPPGENLWSELGFTTSTQAIAILSGTGAWISHDAGRTWTPVQFG